MLLMFFVEDGIGYPSVTSYLCAAIGLVLAVVAPQAAPWLSRQPVLLHLPVPIFLAVAFGFFAFVGYPPAGSASALKTSQYGGVEYSEALRGKKDGPRITDRAVFIRKQIIEPLETAQNDDKTNVRLLTELAGWYSRLWAQLRFDAAGEKIGEDAVRWARRAQKANPEWSEGYRAEFDVRIYIASVRLQDITDLEKQIANTKHPVNERARARQAVDRIQAQRRQQFELAAAALTAYLPRDPTDPLLRMKLASALYEAKSPLAPAMAQEARRLDHLVKPPRSLSDPQRQQLEKWLGKESEK